MKLSNMFSIGILMAALMGSIALVARPNRLCEDSYRMAHALHLQMEARGYNNDASMMREYMHQMARVERCEA